MDEGADVVYGQRTARAGESRFKLLTASLFYRGLSLLSDVKIPLDTGDFRLINRRALDVLNSMPERHRFIRGMVSWIGFNQVPILYERQARFAGSTKYPLRKMVRFAADAVTGFSVRPLQITTYLGLGFAAFGMALLVYVFASLVFRNAVPGWTSVIATVVILGSLQLLMLGVFGEYLGRLYMESKRRPLFVIEEVRRSSPAAASSPAALEPEPIKLAGE
jgi:dolichol-phosphate mannosyltransferase